MSAWMWPILAAVTLLHTVTMLWKLRAYRAAPSHVRSPRVLYSDLFIYLVWMVVVAALVLTWAV